jgi:hypothetical protein
LSLTLREEHGLRVFENRVLRRIFGPKRDEVTGEWRKLQNEELHILYSSPNIIRQIKSRRMRWAGHVARMGEDRKVYKIFMGKPEGKRPLGRPRRRWDKEIRMDLREIGWENVGWIQLAQDRDRWRSCECGYEPSGSGATDLCMPRSSNFLFHLYFPTKILYAFIPCPIRATCPVNRVLIRFNTLDKDCKLILRASLCTSLHSPITYFIRCLIILLINLFSHSLNQCFLRGSENP